MWQGRLRFLPVCKYRVGWQTGRSNCEEAPHASANYGLLSCCPGLRGVFPIGQNTGLRQQGRRPGCVFRE